MAIHNRCIWLIGATSGIGKALALELARQNNFVIASGRNAQALDQLAVAAQGKIKPLAFDVTASGAELGVASQALGAITDYLDCVIYCAGICEYENELAFDPVMYERVFAVNFHGAVKTMHIAMPLLRRASDRPQVALVGSLSSVVGFPRAEAYGASKAALDYFAQALRADCANVALDVRLIRPGFVQTPLTEANDFAMPGLMTAEDAAARIIRGLKGKSFIIDFPHRLALTLGIFKTLPSLWFRWVAPKITRHTAKTWVLGKN